MISLGLQNRAVDPEGNIIFLLWFQWEGGHKCNPEVTNYSSYLKLWFNSSVAPFCLRSIKDIFPFFPAQIDLWWISFLWWKVKRKKNSESLCGAVIFLTYGALCQRSILWSSCFTSFTTPANFSALQLTTQTHYPPYYFQFSLENSTKFLELISYIKSLA